MAAAEPSIGACLAALDEAIEAGVALGLDVGPATACREEARARLGLAPDLYVLALVGGTGVGKSSLLNAVAGTAVSPVGVLRPTSDHPIAWLAREVEPSAGPLLEHAGIRDRRLHDGPAPEILVDLPDIDSVAAEHRAAVEALLPRVDAVAWVTDPEKYADAVMHDEFLRRWVPRLGRQVLVLNKSDRLDAPHAERVRRDLAAMIEREVETSRGDLQVVSTTALGGTAGVEALRRWLADGSDAKRVVAARIGNAAAAAIAELAGPVRGHEEQAFLDPGSRRRAIEASTAEALRLIDLPGAERQAVAATRARARASGAGPIGRLTAWLDRASGRQRRLADPARYLAGWQRRGSLARTMEPVTRAVGDALTTMPPALRPALAASADPTALGERLTGAIDGAIATTRNLSAPTSRLWPVLGLLQTVDHVLIAMAVAWLVAWIVLRPPVGTMDLPLLGPVPRPLVLLGATLVVGYVLASVLSMHARWVGHRWARGVAREVRAELEATLAAEAFAALDAVEAAARRLRLADEAARRRCRESG